MFELSGVTGMSPACVADMISLPSRAPTPKCISAPTCEVPANASLPKIRRRRRLEPGRGLAPLHGRLVGGHGVTYAGVLVDGERHLLLSVGAGEDR